MAKDLKHSPAPWKWVDGVLRDADGETVMSSDGDNLFWGLGHDGPDPKIVAAAPEMLALLRDAKLMLASLVVGAGLQTTFKEATAAVGGRVAAFLARMDKE